MINEKKKIECCGCSACFSICPVKCIEMVIDEEGFRYPTIKNQNNCIKCGLCEGVCPMQMKKAESNLKQAYWAKNINEKIRLNSSSGGIFTALAERVLEMGGIVIGAAFTADFYSVDHIIIENVEELKRLQGSKYTQSNIGNTYNQTKAFLDADRIVLFSGTPCQIAGLKGFLRKEYRGLITVDVICHGVPSPLIWKKYLKNIKQQTAENDIIDVSFRNKASGWKNYSVVIGFNSGYKYQNKYWADIFMQGFLANLYLRPSCYACKFKDENYLSDITLGDFWGIEKIRPQIDDDKGISAVVVRTQKGMHIFNEIKNMLIYDEVEYARLVKENRSIACASEYPPERKNFFTKYKKKGVESLIKKYVGRSLRAKIERKIKRIIFNIINRTNFNES